MALWRIKIVLRVSNKARRDTGTMTLTGYSVLAGIKSGHNPIFKANDRANEPLALPP